MIQLGVDRSDMVPALGGLCPISVGQWLGSMGSLTGKLSTDLKVSLAHSELYDKPVDLTTGMSVYL